MHLHPAFLNTLITERERDLRRRAVRRRLVRREERPVRSSPWPP
jgi:hypothetical protein